MKILIRALAECRNHPHGINVTECKSTCPGYDQCEEVAAVRELGSTIDSDCDRFELLDLIDNADIEFDV